MLNKDGFHGRLVAHLHNVHLLKLGGKNLPVSSPQSKGLLSLTQSNTTTPAPACTNKNVHDASVTLTLHESSWAMPYFPAGDWCTCTQQLHAFHVNICSLHPASGGRSPWLTLSWTASASLHHIPYEADGFVAPVEPKSIWGCSNFYILQ